MNDLRSCTLCGLPVKTSATAKSPQFCCGGCRMVYTMLLESAEHNDPSRFKETDLYKECVAAGVIPDPSKTESADEQEKQNNPTDVTDANKFSDHELPDSLLKLNFRIHHMWCPACAWMLEQALIRSKGVQRAVCNFSSDRASLVYDPVKTSPEKIFSTIKKLGYSPEDLSEKPRKRTKEFIRLAITLFLTMNVMMLSWAIYSGFFMELSNRSVQLIAWPAFIMASVVLGYGGRPIYTRAINSIRTGRPGMETLIITGSFTAYVYSLFHFFKGSIHLYFDAASMLILLTLIGKMIERSAKTEIAKGLELFFSLVPRKVKICSLVYPEGRYVSIDQLKKHDSFLTGEGEILAADGMVTHGSGVIDESSITGEAKPVTVEISDTVKSGTRMISGSIRVKAVDVGTESILGRMLAIMENSLSGKTARTRRFEAFLNYFVPGIMGLSAATFVFWMFQGISSYEAFNRAISVMVISCPCALGLAIPLALVAGVSSAGKKGILVRDFEAFESVKGLQNIVFDKTGTLTTGRMTVLGMDTNKNFSAQKAWQLIYSLERNSEHFIAHTLNQFCIEKEVVPLSLTDIEYFSNGVSGLHQGQQVHLGNLDFVGNHKTRKPSFIIPPPESAQMISTVFLSMDRVIVAAVHLGDFMKPGVKKLISHLGKKGISSFLISGDADRATQDAAAFVKIPVQSAHGNLLPPEKADFIHAIKKSGGKTAMVGDGVNDAPAMAEADIAVAVHSGLHPGEGVAAITLMQENPVQLLDFIFLADHVNQKVKQNLVFAFIYNAISIPIAASGLLNPIIAATAMLLSSLSVTLNTLLLVKRK